MSNYDKILHFFNENSFEDQSYMRQVDLLHLLNKLTRTNTKRQKFDTQIAKQMFDNTPKNLTGDAVMVADYVSTLCKAMEILKQKLDAQIDEYQNTEIQEQRKQIMLNIKTLTEDILIITEPFNLRIIRNTQLIHRARNMSLNESSQINNNYALLNNSYKSIFENEVDPNKQSSVSLTLGIHIIVIAILIEFIIMFQKNGFFNLLSLLMALGIFLMNYFDRVYIQLVFYEMITSIVLDIIWFCFKFNNYWTPQAETVYSLNHDLFLKFVLIFTMIEGVLRVFLSIILFKYRNNPHGIRKTVQFLCLQFDLNSNPIRNIITTKIAVIGCPKFIFN